jgi:hypothetical protein
VTVCESGQAPPKFVEVSRSGMTHCLDKMASIVERPR